MVTEARWRAIWEASGLAERLVQVRPLTAKQEAQDRIKWVGCASVLGVWGRLIRLLLTNPGARDSVKGQLDAPHELMARMGYALFVGHKPQQ